MERAEKVAAVEQLHETFKSYPHVIVTGFSGLSVNQANELRRRVREAGGRYAVIKNRLAKRAAQDTPAEPLAEGLVGPRAIAVHESDPVTLAKALNEFAKDNPQLELLSGLLDGKVVLDAHAVKALADLPGLPELRAQLLSLIQAPATQLVRLLGTPGTQIAQVLEARREQLEKGE